VTVRLGTAALWRAPAHESESRSLAATIWYPEHALREIPHLLVLGLLWSCGWAPPASGAALARRAALLVAVTAIVAGLVFAAAAAEEGVAAARLDLLQGRVASDLAEPGVHFRFHLLSDVALGGALFAAARLTSRRALPRGIAAWLGPLAALVALGIAIALWGVSGVEAPRALGHAAREVETLALVGLPALLAWSLSRARDTALAPAERLNEGPVRTSLIVAAIFVGILALGSTRVDLTRDSSNPGRSLTLNLAVHHFEHLFDVGYLLLAAELTRRSAGRLTEEA